mmetsp:Transcript_4403/g.10630  ORF Transcript_4403/g.10630 Transcript_4403/m.10630 type:complete len:216 (+) Transcript_4403:515-1162(+)
MAVGRVAGRDLLPPKSRADVQHDAGTLCHCFARSRGSGMEPGTGAPTPLGQPAPPHRAPELACQRGASGQSPFCRGPEDDRQGRNPLSDVPFWNGHLLGGAGRGLCPVVGLARRAGRSLPPSGHPRGDAGHRRGRAGCRGRAARPRPRGAGVGTFPGMAAPRGRGHRPLVPPSAPPGVPLRGGAHVAPGEGSRSPRGSQRGIFPARAPEAGKGRT